MYEDRYDHATVEQCLSGENIVNATFRKMEETVPASELKERQAAWYVEYSKCYLYFVEFTAASCYHNRDKVITEWMERDEQKDRRLTSARLSKTPFCRSCGQNMEVMDKYYMHRKDSGHRGEDIIIILSCKPCEQRQTIMVDFLYELFREEGAEDWASHLTNYINTNERS